MCPKSKTSVPTMTVEMEGVKKTETEHPIASVTQATRSLLGSVSVSFFLSFAFVFTYSLLITTHHSSFVISSIITTKASLVINLIWLRVMETVETC